jgi:phosphoglycerate kinase
LSNGPLGIFEIGQAANGTVSLAKAISSSEGISIIGAGELGKAICKNACDHSMRFLRPGRRGSLEFLEGKNSLALQLCIGLKSCIEKL